MAKRGRAYERVVAEIIKALDRGATVHHGHWIVGPDGRRELDVYVEGKANGEQRRVLIECKDFHPKKTGPVGIAHVDALESKRRDLHFDVCFICSNAGFTADAISKAKRVGIGLIAVMREGDKRIRVAVSEEIYIRRVRLQSLTLGLHNNGPIPLAGLPFEAVLYQGIPVANWALHRFQLLVGMNPIVRGSYTASHALKEPTEFTLPSGSVVATRIDFHFTISGGWFAQQITLDASAAVYDWLRRRVRLLPSPGKLHLRGVNLDAGSPVSVPPETELHHAGDLRDGEVAIGLLSLEGIDVREPVPPLDVLIEPKDLELLMPDLPVESYTSVGA